MSPGWERRNKFRLNTLSRRRVQGGSELTIKFFIPLTSHFVPLSKPQRIGFVPISTLELDLTTWSGTSKVHYEQLRRAGRQLSKLQFMRIRIDAKQLIVVNMLTCSEVPGGGTFVSKHNSFNIILKRVQGGDHFVVIPFERNASRANPAFHDVSSVEVPP